MNKTPIQYQLPIPFFKKVDKQEQTPKAQKPLKPARVKKKKSRLLTGIKTNKNLALKIIVLFLFLLGVTLSTYYSFNWFNSSLIWPIALGKALMIVLTSSVFPQLIRHNWKKKNKNKKPAISSRLVAVLILLPCTLIAIGFSMASTIAGLYNARSITMSTESEALAVESAENMEDLKAQEELIKANIELLTQSIESENKFKSTLDAEDWQYWTSVKAIEALNAEIKTEREKLAKLYEVKKETRKETSKEVVKRDDFYTWTASIFGFKPEEAEFWMAAAPAVFIDIIGPIALGVLFGV